MTTTAAEHTEGNDGRMSNRMLVSRSLCDWFCLEHGVRSNGLNSVRGSALSRKKEGVDFGDPIEQGGRERKEEQSHTSRANVCSNTVHDTLKTKEA